MSTKTQNTTCKMQGEPWIDTFYYLPYTPLKKLNIPSETFTADGSELSNSNVTYKPVSNVILDTIYVILESSDEAL